MQDDEVKVKKLLSGVFQSALAAVKSEEKTPLYLPSPPKGKTIVVGAGKAAASMAKAVEDNYSGKIDSGLVVTRYKHGLPLRHIEVVEASHPMPDAAGQQAAQRILELAKTCGPDDLLLCLVSGGGSALLPLPAAGLKLEEIQKITKDLLLCGADIHEINCVRKHVSSIAGGRLARAANGARICTLLVSDIPGDDIATIASGPTLADPTTCADALSIFEKYKLTPPDAVLKHLKEAKDESVKPGDPCLARSESFLIAKPQDALEAAAEFIRKEGITPMIFGNALEGEARDVAKVFAGISRQVIEHGQPLPRPCILLSGGETTVTVKGHGRGGRNCEFLLHFAMATKDMPGIYALAIDTDGIDGTEANAGAYLFPGQVNKMAAEGKLARVYADVNDSYGFFADSGTLIEIGPTLTNVNDFRAIYIP